MTTMAAKQETKAEQPASSGRTSAAALKAIRGAAKGLLYQSETDKPVKAVLWKLESPGKEAAIDADAVRASAQVPAESTVREIDVETFFAPMTAAQDWHGDEEQRTAEGFRALLRVLREQLTDLKAFRVGAEEDTKADIYVVGRTGEGDIAGIATQVVET